MIKIDALVVGLGPAGAVAAGALARAGAKVIALERKREFGVPVQCAELVPNIMAPEVGDIRSAVKQIINEMHVFVEADGEDRAPNFPGRMIDRARFDANLVHAAIAAGAHCQLQTNVLRIDDEGSVSTSSGEKICARVIIGADGPQSIVGKSIGCVNSEFAETRQKTVPLLVSHCATDIFLSAEIEGGYGWLFPKGRVANLGVGVSTKRKSDLKPLLDRLHARLIEERRVGPEVLGYTGGLIPVGGMVEPVGRLCDVDVLLAGDAAGLTNPITGAGINAAVISGALAGAAAVQALAGDASAVDDYSQELKALFNPGLLRARFHRRRLLAGYGAGARPSPETLRQTWISYDGYWDPIRGEEAA